MTLDRRLPGSSAGSFSGRTHGAARNQQIGLEIGLERDAAGLPHAGKVLAAIQPHCDDIPIFAGGTTLKLLAEGYSGILIRTSNDEMAGRGSSVGEVILNNERDNFEVAKHLGVKKIFDLGYRNHLMDGISRLEMRARLIFIFRLMQVDTVISFDPWAHYDENPDHSVTAQVVEAACWMAGSQHDYPEHFEAGLRPHVVSQKYYYARGPQLVNHVVDISSYVEGKIDLNRANVTQGPAGHLGSELRARLALEGKRLPILGDDDQTADREYIRHFLLESDRLLGEQFGVAYAEAFHHIGADEPRLEHYLERNVVAL
jgi:LmbE family N-acetylglucosaminyl deacetylase